MNFLLSSTVRKKPAGQHGDPDPTGASSAAGGVGEGGRELRLEALGAQGSCLCQKHLLSTYYMPGAGLSMGWGGVSTYAQNSVPALEDLSV